MFDSKFILGHDNNDWFTPFSINHASLVIIFPRESLGIEMLEPLIVTSLLVLEAGFKP